MVFPIILNILIDIHLTLIWGFQSNEYVVKSESYRVGIEVSKR